MKNLQLFENLIPNNYIGLVTKEASKELFYKLLLKDGCVPVLYIPIEKLVNDPAFIHIKKDKSILGVVIGLAYQYNSYY